jgi:site-specific recombinase XerD
LGVVFGLRGAKFGAKTKRNLLTDEEVSRLLQACRGSVERFVVYVLLYTGLRVSEFVHMQRSWVSFKSEFIVVPESQPCTFHHECRKKRYVRDWSYGRKVLVHNVWRVKVPEAARSIPLLPEVKPVLEEFFRKHKSVSEVISDRVEAWRIVKTVAERAGLSKRIFPHVLRGVFASILAGKEFDALSIQAILGWKSVKTADEYIRISPQRLMKMTKEKW